MNWENDTFTLPPFGNSDRWFFAKQSVLKKRFGLVLRMRQIVYSSKDFNNVDFLHDSTKYDSIMALTAPKVESLWFLYQAEGLPKNISIEEFLDEPSEQVGALHKTRSFCVPSVASEQSSSGLSNFRQMVTQDA